MQIIKSLINTPTISSSTRKLINKTDRLLPQVLLRRQVHNDDGANNSTLDEKSSITSQANFWCQRFKNEGISEPKESVNHIIAHILGSKTITNFGNLDGKKFNEDQLKKLDALCNCRLSRMPVQYIIGEWDFRDITLKIEPPIFIPRPETEILVDHLLKRINDLKNKTCNVFEIGCGSGAIGLSILQSNKNVNLTAIDINPHACELTMKNAKNLKLDEKLHLFNAKLTENATVEILKEYSSSKSKDFNEKKFDFIISNPPYVPTKKIFKLQPEIKLYEDFKALDGGEDGLQLIKPMIKYASEILQQNGYLILEVDSSHPDKIITFVEENYLKKLKINAIRKDFCDKDRFIEIQKI